MLGLVLGLFTMRRHYKARDGDPRALGATEAASNTTVTPTHGVRGDGDVMRAISPPKGGAAPPGGDSARYALHSFGSTIGGVVVADGGSESPHSSEQGGSVTSFGGRTASAGGRSGITLAAGLGSVAGRARPDSRPDAPHSSGGASG